MKINGLVFKQKIRVQPTKIDIIYLFIIKKDFSTNKKELFSTNQDHF